MQQVVENVGARSCSCFPPSLIKHHSFGTDPFACFEDYVIAMFCRYRDIPPVKSHHVTFKEKNLRERSKYLNFWKRRNEYETKGSGTSAKRPLNDESVEGDSKADEDEDLGIPKKMLKMIGDVKTEDMPYHIRINKKMWKYWFQRYRLFSKYDEGILMDEG